jgi:hypothetical protein
MATTYTIHSARAHREGLTLQEAADAMLLTREDIGGELRNTESCRSATLTTSKGGAHEMVCVEDGTDIQAAIDDCNANDKRGAPIIL